MEVLSCELPVTSYKVNFSAIVSDSCTGVCTVRALRGNLKTQNFLAEPITNNSKLVPRQPAILSNHKMSAADA